MTALDYNKARWGDLDIKHLVIDTQRYIVFIDHELYVDWVTSDEFDEAGHLDAEAHNAVLSGAALLECKPNTILDPQIRLDFKRLLGEAIARSLSADYATANSILVEAATFLRDRCEEQARKWRLKAAGEATLVTCIAAVLIWSYRGVISLSLGEKIILLAVSAAMGAMGALLSVIMRIGREHPDCHAGQEIHAMEGRYRILAGIISAVFVAFALWAKIALPALTGSRDAGTTILFAALIAGLSERWAPSISSSFTKGGEKGEG